MFTLGNMLKIIKDGLINKLFIENIKPYGVFSYEAFENDKLVAEYSEKNLIVDGAFDIVSSLLTTGDANKVIAGIAVGDQGIVDSVELPPYPNDTTLRNEVFRNTLTSYSINSTTKTISFKLIIIESEANGTGAQVINEAAIYSVDGTLFARKVFREFIKTPVNRLVITWAFKWA